jgi:cell division septum initiation protein DivIVA
MSEDIVESLMKDIEDLKEEIKKLEKINAELRKELKYALGFTD